MEIRSAESFVGYWSGIRGRTRRVVEAIPPDRIDWAPAAGRWSLGDIVRHLAGIERDMYAENVRGGPTRYPGHGRELADGYAAVLAYHDRKHAESLEIFRALTPEQLQAKVQTPAGTPITAWKWLRAMVEHESHHRGQLYLMLGLIGVATPPIFGLTEEEVFARSTRERGVAL
jgi:uncharacterized damage-inducible protein DinB